MHHHKWIGAFHVLRGSYELGLGWETSLRGHPGPPVAATVVLRPGTYYAMEHTDVWHHAFVLEDTLTTCLVLRDPRGIFREEPPMRHVVLPMSAEEAERMLDLYKPHFGVV
jgi:hypothetical protein